MTKQPDPTGSPALSAKEVAALKRVFNRASRGDIKAHEEWIDNLEMNCLLLIDTAQSLEKRLRAALADAARERERADKIVAAQGVGVSDYVALFEERDQLAARVKELEGALKFYADPENWKVTTATYTWDYGTEAEPRDPEVLADGGETARDALQGE